MNRAPRRVNFWAALVPAAMLLLVAAFSVQEWWQIGYVADPTTIASYHFGSEAMVGHGGRIYRSAEAYAASALWLAAASLGLAAFFVAALVMGSRRTLVAAYVVLGMAIAVKQVAMYAL